MRIKKKEKGNRERERKTGRGREEVKKRCCALDDIEVKEVRNGKRVLQVILMGQMGQIITFLSFLFLSCFASFFSFLSLLLPFLTPLSIIYSWYCCNHCTLRIDTSAATPFFFLPLILFLFLNLWWSCVLCKTLSALQHALLVQ